MEGRGRGESVARGVCVVVIAEFGLGFEKGMVPVVLVRWRLQGEQSIVVVDVRGGEGLDRERLLRSCC